MAKVKINLPNTFPYATETRVRIGDINYGGHLGNDAILALIHEARLRFLQEHGYSERDIEGAGIILVDAAVIYQAESFHGDLLRIEVALGDFTQVRCDFYYRLTNVATGKLVATAKTGVAFFDYAERAVVEIPEHFREKFSEQV
jgi:acyl-CoA thioester hydrolase